jgi:dipeptidyl aminopeptidase/acylaminoacyl peptidase
MDGLIDPNRIGIIGFSRTCFYILQALTSSALQFKAASITDGVNHGYLQYILNIDAGRNSVAHEADETIGAAPFGVGLQQWLERSPVFQLDKVTTPLEIVATREQILQMWEPYAALRYLHRPVDLTILNSDEHVFTNPGVRLISQGGTVDWFRYWLQGYEDPSPAKSEQYKRWGILRSREQSQVEYKAVSPVQ